ncbi:hypothetical protein RFI_02482 [Reticulomyxa filosa]|uniref:RRM domain-containing protein n=1 Tax=Reticulomyxa filosa TaxID=46433 RepID=X6P8T4_RETFI|nr:hypothetical protein RFI_02482 [Reticulomyxa filosa]|eukprot:ETO34606.1 hypothetical protein RFI_02482 [Reticulomyxa filosa]
MYFVLFGFFVVFICTLFCIFVYVCNVYCAFSVKWRFAFIEFRSAEEATQAMDLDGIQFYGESLKIGRPANYNPSLVPDELKPKNVAKLNTARLGIVSNHVPNGPNKLYCGGIPYSLTEDQIRELLQTYGPLKALFLAKDPLTGFSKGYCFFQYEDPSVTDEAIAGLNGIKIGDRQLAVRRHTPAAGSSIQNATTYNPLNQMFGDNPLEGLLSGANNPFGTTWGASDTNVPVHLEALMNNQKGNVSQQGEIDPNATNILCLLEMVSEESLIDDAEFGDLYDDVKEECSKYGDVLSMEIPRPTKKSDGTLERSSGVGKIFVEYRTISEATQAKNKLEGRTFDDRTVMATYYPVAQYNAKKF